MSQLTDVAQWEARFPRPGPFSFDTRLEETYPPDVPSVFWVGRKLSPMELSAAWGWASSSL
jgi:hypothetical protein